jgi:hypothetical protein
MMIWVMTSGLRGIHLINIEACELYSYFCIMVPRLIAIMTIFTFLFYVVGEESPLILLILAVSCTISISYAAYRPFMLEVGASDA